jgi:hypothetical protein
VVGKNAIRAVAVPESRGTCQVAAEEDRGRKPMLRAGEGPSTANLGTVRRQGHHSDGAAAVHPPQCECGWAQSARRS